MTFRRRHYYTLFGITLLLAVVCGFLIPRVNVNSDMTKYLPDHSQMKEGLAIVDSDFGGAQMAIADVKAMFRGLDEQERAAIADSLSLLPQVDGVSMKVDASGVYTLYELNVSKSVDQKMLGKEIGARYGKEVVVETSQDGATPPVSVLVIAAVLIVFILVLMAQSWLEPLIFLLTTGVAVVLNIGSNALLPSVSITTNYIVAILQMVLSLDYSIVLINRYRQEQCDDKTSAQAVNTAIRKAFPSIFSSALTTVVGLGMLCFMRLKIGMDMGLVLGKGVLWSLICAFTVLPALLMLFDKGVRNTSKKTFVLPTDKIGRFVTRNNIALSLFALALFIAAFFFSRKTDISFSMITESKITKVFPQKNPVVLIFDTCDEMEALPLADSLLALDGVESVVSYATLLKKEYTADAMAGQLGVLAEQFSDYASEVPQGGVDQISPEIMRMVYYLKFQDDPQMRVTFPDMAEFIMKNCMDNPMFSSFIDDKMRSNLNLLQTMSGIGLEEESEPDAEQPSAPQAAVTEAKTGAVTPSADQKPSASKPETKPETSVDVKPVAVKPAVNTGSLAIIETVTRIVANYPSEESSMLLHLVDTASLRRKMNASEMGRFIGSTATQTKMVYSFAKGKTMTPLEYVHFLADDLFNRKALSSMVSSDQKQGLRLRAKIMDYANSDSHLSAGEIASMVSGFGVRGVTEAAVKDLVAPKAPVVAEETQSRPPKPSDTPVPPRASADSSEVRRDSLSIVAADTVSAAAPVTAPVKPVKTREERRAELFSRMMSNTKGYTAAELAKNFKSLGQDIAPETVSLLYAYYGSVRNYDDSSVMGIEDLVEFGTGTLVDDPRLSPFITGQMRESVDQMKSGLVDGVGVMRNDAHSIMLISTNLPKESPETYDFVDKVNALCSECLDHEHYTVGESVMFSEMKNGFGRELKLVTWLTVIAIFLIVAISFRSLIVPLILVVTVMTAVYVNVVFSGVFSGTMLYLAYLIVQSILMGATIDYGILFTNYYKEKRLGLPIDAAVSEAYHGSIRTIMTSGLIMVAAPGAMSLMVEDVAISAIVGCLAIGAFVAIVLILGVLPGVLVAFDRFIVHNKKK